MNLFVFIVSILCSTASFSYSKMALASAKENANRLENLASRISDARAQSGVLPSANSELSQKLRETLKEHLDFVARIPEHLAVHDVNNALELHDLASLCMSENIAGVAEEIEKEGLLACQFASSGALVALVRNSYSKGHLFETVFLFVKPLWGWPLVTIVAQSLVLTYAGIETANFVYNRFKTTKAKPAKRDEKKEELKQRKQKKVKATRRRGRPQDEPTLKEVLACLPPPRGTMGETVVALQDAQDYGANNNARTPAEAETISLIREMKKRLLTAQNAQDGTRLARVQALNAILEEAKQLEARIDSDDLRLCEDDKREYGKFKGVRLHVRIAD